MIKSRKQNKLKKYLQYYITIKNLIIQKRNATKELYTHTHNIMQTQNTKNYLHKILANKFKRINFRGDDSSSLT